jgi:hypothetical protein
MAWCPNCKLEYREGITVCADCGTTLVDKLDVSEEAVCVLLTEKSDLAQRFHDFLVYSGISGATISFQEESQDYRVFVPVADEKEAKRLFTGFYLGETEKEAITLSEEELSTQDSFVELTEAEPEEEIYQLREAASVYVTKEEKYKDYSSTAWSFLIVGIAGLIFTALNIMGYFSFFANPVSYTVALLLFILCLFVSISSFRSAKKAKSEIAAENDFTVAIKQWMEENIREGDFPTEETASEILFLNRMNEIKAKVVAQFGEIDEGFLDEITEEFYNTHFEK